MVEVEKRHNNTGGLGLGLATQLLYTPSDNYAINRCTMTRRSNRRVMTLRRRAHLSI